MSLDILFGIDLFLESGEWRRYERDKVLVLTNISAVTSNLSYSIIELKKRLNVLGVLAPEHGFWGIAQAGEEISHEYDVLLNLDVYSLYTRSREPVLGILRESDVVIVDIQDLGLRHYTYVSALMDLMDLMSKTGVNKLIVLDRPNPLGAEVVEGPLIRPETRSYVGYYEIPIRYGATLAELAKLYNYERGLGLEIDVYPVRNWLRSMDFLDTNLQWIPPSPAIPTPETAFIYGSTVYLEATNISEGRGTYTPFRVFGAPFIDPFKLSEELNKEISELRFRPTRFRPLFSKYSGEICGGAYVHLINRKSLRIFETGLKILSVIYRLYEKNFELLRSGDKIRLDLLTGDPEARKVVFGERSLKDYIVSLNDELKEYEERLNPHKIYKHSIRSEVSRSL